MKQANPYLAVGEDLASAAAEAGHSYPQRASSNQLLWLVGRDRSHDRVMDRRGAWVQGAVACAGRLLTGWFVEMWRSGRMRPKSHRRGAGEIVSRRA